MPLFRLLPSCSLVTPGGHLREARLDVALEWLANGGKVSELGAAQRTLVLAEAAHRVVEAPEAERVATVVDRRLVQRLEADGALQVVEGDFRHRLGSEQLEAVFRHRLVRSFESRVSPWTWTNTRGHALWTRGGGSKFKLGHWQTSALSRSWSRPRPPPLAE
eukprot:1998744-Prymnesium_polylepis.3